MLSFNFILMYLFNMKKIAILISSILLTLGFIASTSAFGGGGGFTTNFWKLTGNVLSPASDNYSLSVGDMVVTGNVTGALDMDGDVITNIGDAGTDFNSSGGLTLAEKLYTDEVRARSSAGLKLYDDGGNGIFVEDDGNVGIGTTEPNEKLHLLSASSTTIKVESTGVETDAFLELKTASTNWKIFNDESANRLTFNDGSGARMVIQKTTGNVGIGTTSPDTKLQVVGDAKIGDDNTNYLSIATDGELSLHGTARIKKSMWLPFNALKAPGTKPAAFVDHGISGAWEFSDGTDDTLVFNIQTPVDMDKTVAPTMLIGWSTNTTVTSETCTWQLEYLWTSEGEDTTAAAQETLTIDSNAISQANGLIMAEITGIDLPSGTDVCIHCRLKRLGAGGNDDLTDTSELHGICFKYTSNKLGE